jgi:hypothetical protein
MLDLALLLLFGAAAVAWFHSRKSAEIAVTRCREACRAAGLQFLDDVAPVTRWTLARDHRGTLRIRRIYSFDYTTARGERRSGSLVMLGHRPMVLELEGDTIVELGDSATRPPEQP